MSMTSTSSCCAGNLTIVPDTEQIILQFGAPFTSGRVLSLHFEYPLSSGLSGFYRSDYQGMMPTLVCQGCGRAGGVSAVLKKATTQGVLRSSSCIRNSHCCSSWPSHRLA